MRWHCVAVRPHVLIFPLVLCLAGTVAAQQDNLDQRMDTLRELVPQARDAALVDEWLRRDVDRLVNTEDAPSLAALQSRFIEMYTDERNNREFTKLFGARAAQALATAMQRGAGLPAEPARVVARCAATVGLLDTRETLLAGLGHPDQATRYLCAKALRDLINEIDADAGLAVQTLDAIATTGGSEINGVVASMIYRAMDYPNRGDEVRAAVLKMLTGRIDQMRQGNAEPSNAEGIALELIGRREPTDKAEEAQIVEQLAPLLRLHTLNVANASATEQSRKQSQDVILETEKLLVRLVKPSGEQPNIRGPMLKGGSTAVIDMQLELIKWIGADQNPQVLNRAPWSVAVGAP